MAEAFTLPPDTLPPDAELALSAERVMRLKGTIVVGRVECAELRLGDVVVAVGAGPICQGRVCGWERFPRPPAVVRRGEEIALMFSHWDGYDLPQDVRLFRVQRHKQADSAAGPDRGGM
jgi:translation elongation factor EF-Tu-like GTPase